MSSDGSASRLGSTAPPADPGRSMLAVGGWVVSSAALVVVVLVVGG